MEVIAKGKYIQVSPKKVRDIADLIRGKNAKEAQVMVKGMPQKSAFVIGKVLASAMANAESNFNLDKNALTISKITVDGGPALKRWEPRAKGAAYAIKKRTSHITVVVSGDVKTKVKKQEVKQEAKEIKEEEAHKIEVERPAYIDKKQSAGAKEVKTKIFRRKTG